MKPINRLYLYICPSWIPLVKEWEKPVYPKNYFKIFYMNFLLGDIRKLKPLTYT